MGNAKGTVLSEKTEMLHGIRALSNAELIAILIGSGNVDETAVELSPTYTQFGWKQLEQLG